MNDQQLNKSERIASLIMRILAVIGLVAVLALAAWLLVLGARALPTSSGALGAAVSSVTSVFSSADEDAVQFALTNASLLSGESTSLAWEHEGDAEDSEFSFSYACVDGVSLSTMNETGWSDLACDTPLRVVENELTIVPSSTEARFSDVDITIALNDSADTTTLTVINSDIDAVSALDQLLASTDEDDTASVAVDEDVVTETAAPETPAVVDPTPAAPVVTQPVVIRPVATGPADLAVAITETGVLMPVAGENTFFPVSPIPSDKTAGVRFTVTNTGNSTSGVWAFVANLPVEGDSDYRYVSPAQAGIAPGVEVEFTLGFDDVLEASSGTIRVEVRPTDANDTPSNNVDSVRVDINEK